jgi:hypothetical protein
VTADRADHQASDAGSCCAHAAHVGASGAAADLCWKRHLSVVLGIAPAAAAAEASQWDLPLLHAVQLLQEIH